MDPQNSSGPDGTQPQETLPSPQQASPGYVPSPQAPFPQPGPPDFGQQPAMPGQGQPPKKNSGRSVWVIVGVVSALLLIAVGLAIWLAIKGADLDPQSSTRAYTTPAGLLPDFQAKEIKAAKFKLSASYITGGNFDREGKLYLDKSQGHYDLVPDTEKVNELLKNLYTKPDPKAVFDSKNHGATRNFSFDFNALLGFQYLYDQNATVGGYIADVQAGQKDAAKATAMAITPTEACDGALADVLSKTGSNMTTRSLFFDYSKDGFRTKATVSYASRQTVDRSVRVFFEKCYNLESPLAATQKLLAAGLKENTTKSPTFVYWTENGKLNLVIEPELDTFSKSEIKFEFSDLNAVTGSREGETASFMEKRNLYGLTYSLCRVPPVMASNSGSGYVFLPEDAAYKYPADTDSVYYCITSSVSSEYKQPVSMAVKYVDGITTTATGAAINDFRVLHDLQYQIEKFNSANKRYPSPNEYNDLVNNNMEKLKAPAQQLAKSKALVYTSTPTECIGNCDDYFIDLLPQAGLKLHYRAYEP
jgi:hypothetical protein